MNAIPMNNLDLTTRESCLAYLRSLGDAAVELPSGGELTSGAADAVSHLADEHASVWARTRGRWVWTAAELVAEFSPPGFDPFIHTIEAAVQALAESPALDACMSWDGGDNYRVGPGPEFAPTDNEHRVILTRAELLNWTDGETDSESLSAAVEWVRECQKTWFQEA